MSTPTDTKPEETPEPVDTTTPVPAPEADEHGWVHIGHEVDEPVATPNCGSPCYRLVGTAQ